VDGGLQMCGKPMVAALSPSLAPHFFMLYSARLSSLHTEILRLFSYTINI